jgi:hypothetical protein
VTCSDGNWLETFRNDCSKDCISFHQPLLTSVNHDILPVRDRI